MKRRIMTCCAAFMVSTMMLVGCGSSADSGKYVKGVLDVAYGKSVDDYVEAADVKEADAKKYSTQALESEVDALQAYFSMDTKGSDKTEKAFEEVCKLLFDKVSYTVEEKDGKVTIKVKSVTALQSEAVREYVDAFNIKEFVDGDSTCTDEAFAEGLLGVLKSEGVDVSDKETEITVSVEDKDGKPSISDEDLAKIDEAAIVY